jgi:hypothetical protein
MIFCPILGKDTVKQRQMGPHFKPTGALPI